MANVSVLVIEDDPDIRELLTYNFAKEGWTSTAHESAEKGIMAIRRGLPDIVVLDLMLPGMDGLGALKSIKADPVMKRIPVILATAKGEDSDIVTGLELGADDYVTKPFSPKVLIARMRKALRTSADAVYREDADVIVCGPFKIDPARHAAFAGNESLNLSATEFSLLELFMRNPGWVFSRTHIIDAVRGSDYPVTDRAVDVQILGLRKKLGAFGDLIETVRSVGYRLKDVSGEKGDL